MFHHNSAFATERWRPLLHLMITMFLLQKNRCVPPYRRQCSVVNLGFQNGLRSSRISTIVFPHAFVVVGIIELSAVDHSTLNDRRTFQGSCPRNCEQTCRSLLLCPVLHTIPEFVTTMRRLTSPGSLIQPWTCCKKAAAMIVGTSMDQEIFLIHGQVSHNSLY